MATTEMTQKSNGALAPNTPVAGRLQGAESSDLILPRVHIYQGVGNEAKQYGKGFKPGDMINTITGEKIKAAKFIPIMGYKQWIKWKEPRGSGMEYNFREKDQVPPEDLKWSDSPPAAPAAQEYINWISIFEGDFMPLVFSFTKTCLGVGKTINTCETMLRNKKSPGLYAIEMQEKSNDKGAWMSPRVRPLGDPSPEFLAVAMGIFNSISGQNVVTDVEEPSDFDPDAH